MTWLSTTLHWGSKHQTWIHLVLILLFAIIIHVVTAFVYKHFLSKLKSEKHRWPLVLLDSLRKPIVVLIWYLACIYILFDVITFFDAQDNLSVLKTVLSLGITIICLWFLIGLIKNTEQALLQKKHYKGAFDRTTVDGLAKVARIVLFFIGILAILQTFGVPLTAIYTAAGGAGIGITLAAQDMLKNFFGGLVLYFDRPFSIGDWISSPDKNIEGTVEKIGWRTTRIRTFDKRPLYVPNATFLTVSVENPSRMQFRRIKVDVGVRYNDFRVLATITTDIETMLANDEDIAADQTIWVNLVDFAASSLNFRIYCFTKTTDWVTFQKVQQNVFLKVLTIIENNGAEAAFPTETLHIPNGLTLHNEDKINVITPAN